MSRYTEVIVLARDAEEVMEPLTRPDPERDWHQCFTRVDDSVFDGSGSGSPRCYTWVVQFLRHNWRGLLPYLGSLAWPDPYSVQVLVRDEEDDCFGLWMLYDGELTEIPLPRTTRDVTTDLSVTGVLSRTDRR
ncbi:hypothetical protein ACFXG6_25225 [Streptomyces roseus]|uniref:hypothetical protein n=1 Tax=Streptomyces roseus TaxID=66430 RepID=UPI0036D0CF42